MSQHDDTDIDALSLSRLGRSIDAAIRAERADLESVLLNSGQLMERVESRLDKLAEMIGAGPAQTVPEPWTDLRDALAHQFGAAASAMQRAADAIERLDAIRAETQAAAAAEVARETERLQLLHQAQVESQLAGQKHLADALRDKNAGLEAELGMLRQHNLALIERNCQLKASLEMSERQIGELVPIRAQLRDLSAEKDQLSARLLSAEQGRAQAEAEGHALAKRIEALKRNAKARDAMFREEIMQVTLAERFAAGSEAARATLAEQQLAALSAFVGRDAAPFLASAERLASAADAAVSWLAGHAPQTILKGPQPDAAFEAACGQACGDGVFVSAAYRWLLGRPDDEVGAAHYLRRLSASMTRKDLLIDLARSGEAKERIARLVERLPADADQFIAQAYKQILGRQADEKGKAHYAQRLASGGSREAVVIDLARSSEAAKQRLLLASALRLIEMVRSESPFSSFRRALFRHAGLASTQSRQAWKAGRLAVLAGDARRTWLEVTDRIAELQATAEARVKAAEAHAQHVAGQLPAVQGAWAGSSAANDVIPAPSPLQLLEDDSAERTPQNIRRAIRVELGMGSGL